MLTPEKREKEKKRKKEREKEKKRRRNRNREKYTQRNRNRENYKEKQKKRKRTTVPTCFPLSISNVMHDLTWTIMPKKIQCYVFLPEHFFAHSIFLSPPLKMAQKLSPAPTFNFCKGLKKIKNCDKCPQKPLVLSGPPNRTRQREFFDISFFHFSAAYTRLEARARLTSN